MSQDLDRVFRDNRMGEPQQQRPVRPNPQREMMRQGQPMRQGQGMPQGRQNVRRKKNQTTSIIVLAVEVVVFIALIILFFVLKGKIEKGNDAQADAAAQGTSGGVNVDSEDFTLTCTKVQLSSDVNGNPVAMIYFNFTNKTDTPLSMAEVYPPSLTQNGTDCSTDVTMTEYPTEYSNKDMQISGGQTAECCFVFSLTDLTSPVTLTIHDNYSTFTDIGSQTINLS